MPLERADRLEAFLQYPIGDKLGRQLLRLEQIRMDAHHQYFLVIRAVEDADMSTLREALGGAPQEIVIELLGARPFEGVHIAPLRIEARHNVLDDAVLA